jgi:methyl-accepting chemotaxis protein
MLAQKEVDHLNWANKLNGLLTDAKSNKLEVETDDHNCGFGKWLYGEERKEAGKLVPGLAPLFGKIEEPHRKLHESAIAIGGVFKQADGGLPVLLAEREVDHMKWATKIRDAMRQKMSSLGVETDPAKCALGKWLESERAKKAHANGDQEFRKFWDEMLVSHRALHESAAEVEKGLSVSEEAARKVFDEKTSPLLSKTLQLLDELKAEAHHELEGIEKSKEIYAAQTIPALHAVQDLLHEIRGEARRSIMTDAAMLDAARSTRGSVSILGGAAIAMGIFLAFFIGRGITRALRKMSTQVSEATDQVASASVQVSSTSQSLAEGASEQASSLEETSAALEEMASMTNQNADNANQANSLMSKVNQVVGHSNDSMNKLINSMKEISSASEETQKIVKTIDEIAFQTNLLALNAAVEAARAGDAGAGFAVVADEVRNLAMRAAEAAKNTAQLIESTVTKVKDGVDLVMRTNDAFSDVSRNSAKVGELVGEIAAASSEQAQGITQVNKAMAEMDKVVQQTAANAEESASAAEEMNAQAEQMQDFVMEMAALVGGSRGNGSAVQRRVSVDRSRAESRPRLEALSQHAQHKQHKGNNDISASNGKNGANGAAVSMRKKEPREEVRPDQVIPFEKEACGNF